MTVVDPKHNPVTLRTDGPTLKQFREAGYEDKHYPPHGYEANPPGTTPPEPAGAARFTAVSYTQSASSTVAGTTDPATTSVTVLEARLTELEAVVHQVASFSRNAEHSTIQSWCKKVSARLKALL